MPENERQYYISYQSTGEKIPVTKEEFDIYYHDIDLFRRKQQRHGRCVCPRNRELFCDMECYICPFHRCGDERSLDYIDVQENGCEVAWVDEIPEDSPLLEDIVANTEEMQTLISRLSELMPEVVTIGKLRLSGNSDRAISAKIGMPKTTIQRRIKKAKKILKKEFPDFFNIFF